MQRVLVSKGTRLLGFAKDRLEAHALLWIPLHVIDFAFGQEKVFGTHLSGRHAQNLYDAVGGRWIAPLAALGPPHEVQMSAPVLPVVVKADDIHTTIQNLIDRRLRASERSRPQINSRLTALGVPFTARIRTVDIVNCETIYLPALVGLYRNGSNQRIVAVDGYRGVSQEAINDSLTSMASKVMPYLGR
jgi:hypothetical protein